ncbi:MAG TPA: hypothetical protein VFE62_10565 [Gemmataceae bacterium]|nr:hypothetical protein [Gemmataceae bacterium]
MRIAIGCVALALLIVNAGYAQEPSTEMLIQRLGSAKFVEREKAARTLRARGPGVLPDLRKALTLPDAELQRRLRELIAALETEQLLAPKRVTLSDEPRTLTDFLAEVKKQTGFEVTADSDDAPIPFRCLLKDVLFWEALDRIARASGHRIEIPMFATWVHLKRDGHKQPFVQVQGSFRLAPSKIREEREFDFTRPGNAKESGAHDHIIVLSLGILAEPRFHFISVVDTEILSARDEYGNALLTPKDPPEKKRRREKFHSNDDGKRADFQQETEIYLQRLSSKSRMLKELRGFIHVQVVVSRKTIVVAEKFPDCKGLVFDANGKEKITISSITVDKKDGFWVQIDVPRPIAGVRMKWVDRLFLEDEHGNRFRSTGTGSSSGVRHTISKYFEVKGDFPPRRLLFEDWVIQHHAIPFEFKDVLLP